MGPLEDQAERFQRWRNIHPLAWTVILIVLLVILVVLFFVIRANKAIEGYPEFIPLFFILALFVPFPGALFNLWKFYRANNQKNFDLSFPDS
jgi:hypothetical protein